MSDGDKQPRPKRPRASRREFLQGRAAAEEVAHWAGRAADRMAGPADPQDRSFTFHVARRAMATDFQVLLNARQDPQAPEAALEALDCIERLEDQLSVYRPLSEVSRINDSAADGPVALSENLCQLLQRAQEISQWTGGAFDITAGPLSKAWGFHQRRGRWPSEEALEKARSVTGWEALNLDLEKQTVEFLLPELEINLGAIGKGYALDEAAGRLDDAGVEDYLVFGGLSSVAARGQRTGDSGWPVGVRHPLKPQKTRGADHAMRPSDGDVGMWQSVLSSSRTPFEPYPRPTHRDAR